MFPARPRASSRRNPGNCAPQGAWRGSGAIGVGVEEARELTEGFETRDLKEAKALLDGLA
jgi:hypothetical protein